MEKRIGKRLGLMQPKLSSVWHTGPSGGAPDSVRCARLVRGELIALGIRRQRTTIIHRTVRWCIGLSGESSMTNSSLSGNEKGNVAKIHRTVRWCTGLSGEPTVASANGRPCNLRATRGHTNGRLGTPDCQMCTGQCTMRQPIPRTNGRLLSIWKEIEQRT